MTRLTADDLQHLPRMLAQRPKQGEARRRRRPVERHTPAQEEADPADHHAQQEGQAPAPGDDPFQGHRVEDRGAHGGAQQDAGDRAEGRPGGGGAALVRMGGLGEEDRRAGIFAADGEALHDAAEQHQQRGGDADLGVGGQATDDEGGHRHRDHRPEQGGAAADAIADIAEQDGAERAHEEADREDGEGGEQGGPRVVTREVEVADGSGEEAVDREVVPLHDVAGDAGRDHPPARTVSFRARHHPRFLGRHRSPARSSAVVSPLRRMSGRLRAAPVGRCRSIRDDIGPAHTRSG